MEKLCVQGRELMVQMEKMDHVKKYLGCDPNGN